MVVGVNVSSFKLKKKNTKKDECISFYSDFTKYTNNCLYNNCNNVIEVIKKFYESMQLPEKIDNYKKYFGAKKDSIIIEEKEDRIYISFTILCGAYGINSSITDVETNEIVYNRKLNNADVKDFRIMFAFSKEQNKIEIKKGVILFEVLGSYGVKTITTNKFKKFLSDYFNIMPFFYSLTTREAFEKLVRNGNLKKINLIKNEVNPKFSSMIGANCGKEVRTIAVKKIKEKNNFIDIIMNLMTSDDEVYEIEEINETYNDISLTIDIGGRTKTTRLKEFDSIYIVENLPEDVLDITGELVVPKINNAMMNYADEYLDNLVEGEENDD